MSGFVGIVHFDGRPVDRALLQRLTGALAFRGPDAQRMWLGAHVGLGHSLLRISEGASDEQQPFSLDGASWIAADARIDAQRELIAQLEARSEHVGAGVSDVELLLRAYRAWGEDCVAHLLGDFAFAIWDAPRRRLFCARDQLGVRSLFYAPVAGGLIVSNTLDCLRLHPAVSSRLHEDAVADFLLFGGSRDVTRTIFADIRKLAPAHTLRWDAAGPVARRYWSLPIEEPLLLRRADDYPERFRELLEVALADRLRADRVGVFMSGGLDSTTLAALSCRLLPARDGRPAVRALTTVIDEIDGGERHYAELVARHLGIPMHVLDLSGRFIDPGWFEGRVHTPEPVGDPTRLLSSRAHFREATADTRLVLYGEGPDNYFGFEWQAYLAYLAATGRYGRLASDVARHVVYHRRVPLLSTIPRMIGLRRRRRAAGPPTFPAWIEPGFEARLQLRERWERALVDEPSSAAHPARPRDHASFCDPVWDGVLRSFDSEVTGTAAEVSHPYLDLRLVRFALTVPAVPWCRRKHIVRRAMRGLLPPAVLARDKTPLSTEPALAGTRRLGLPVLEPTPELAAYVDVARVPRASASSLPAFRADMVAFGFAYWLRNATPPWPTLEHRIAEVLR